MSRVGQFLSGMSNTLRESNMEQYNKIPANNDPKLASRIKEIEAYNHQRQKQQGLGRPIISTTFKGHRIIAVGNSVYWSKRWFTFHDFLLEYIRLVLGKEWGALEEKKKYEDRHPLVQWWSLVCKYKNEMIKENGKIVASPMTGAVAAYLGLSYNLYLIAHNAEVQSRLLKRIKNAEQFHGAYYETFVAASFIKAGFLVSFENENDRTTKHCEFTARHQETGNMFSIEAKSRTPYRTSFKIGNQLNNALRKRANHTRVVFIDVNVPFKSNDVSSELWLRKSLYYLRKNESSKTINNTSAPSAYVFVTNHPHQYNLENTNLKHAIFAEGFKIPDFKIDTKFSNIRDALKAREKHKDMYLLIESLKNHYDIPSTFDGEIPEFAYGEPIPRLIIGHNYLIPNGDGKEIIGKLTQATILEKEKLAWGVYKTEDGRNIIATCPITDDELSAYKKHPDTFFGVYKKANRQVKDPLDLFDFFYNTYRNTPKEKLLEFLKDHPNFESIKNETQEELAIFYCEALVNSAIADKMT